MDAYVYGKRERYRVRFSIAIKSHASRGLLFCRPSDQVHPQRRTTLSPDRYAALKRTPPSRANFSDRYNAKRIWIVFP